MAGTDEVPSGSEAADVKKQSSITIPMETVTALFTKIHELEQKLESLEAKLSEDKTDSRSKDGVLKRSISPKQIKRRNTEADDVYTNMVDYFRKRQYEDGSWEWENTAKKDRTTPEDNDLDDDPAERKPFCLYLMEKEPPTLLILESTQIYKHIIRLVPPESDYDVFVADGEGVEIQSPFPLLHIKSDIEDMRDKTPSHDPLHKELCVLVDMYKKEPYLAQALKKYSDITVRRMIDWMSLRGLFRKGKLVVYRVLPGEWALGKLTAVSKHTRSVDDDLVLQWESIDHDGKDFRYVSMSRIIKQFERECPISELSVFPLDYHDDKESLVKISIESGKNWKKLHEKLFDKDRQRSVVRVMEYNGYAEKLGERGVVSQVISRVIVDPTMYTEQSDLTFARHNKVPFDTNTKDPKDVSDEQYLLCPVKVLVHAFSDNEWYYVASKRLREASWRQNAWDRLVIDQDIKEQAYRLFQLSKAHQKQEANGGGKGNNASSSGHGHDYDQNEPIDNFRGKGRGLTFLLHGPPGVGKTLLAECLSEEQKRPLYRVNLGNLTDYDQTHTDKLFRQAHSWNAILLIDEAEVILAERTMENMKQSAWVAVFLRKIEYFEGILFLTTNQIHFMDQAFESRVTVGIRFPRMDKEQRLKIWEKLLEPEKELKKDKLVLDKDRLSGWAEYELNGRHIRNVIRSALLLTQGGDKRKPSTLIDDCLSGATGFMDVIREEKNEQKKSYLSQWY